MMWCMYLLLESLCIIISKNVFPLDEEEGLSPPSPLLIFAAELDCIFTFNSLNPVFPPSLYISHLSDHKWKNSNSQTSI